MVFGAVPRVCVHSRRCRGLGRRHSRCLLRDAGNPRGRSRAFAHVSVRGFGFDEPPTRVGIDLIPQGPVTLVEVCHDCTDAPQTRTIVSPVGWLKSLSRLKTWLETGTPMPWPEDAEV